MNPPNWKHNSGKEPKRKLKPQALRAARERRRQLIKCLQKRPDGRFFSIIGISNTKIHDSKARNQITTC